jgi:ubiquitin-protein ligase
MTTQKSIETEQNVSRITIKRLLLDVKDIIKHPLTDQGIYYSHHESNLLKGYAMIIGPEDTCYEGGFYFFGFNFPTDYPFSPPKLTYCTSDGVTRFNPNLYINGKVCVSILNTWRGDSWTSCQSIRTVLLSLCILFTDNPLLNEPGILAVNPECKMYRDIIVYKNYNVAMLDVMSKNKRAYPQQFDIFYSFAQKHFLDNVDKYIEKIGHKKEEIGTPENVRIVVRIYGMVIMVNYDTLLKRMTAVKTAIKNSDQY